MPVTVTVTAPPRMGSRASAQQALAGVAGDLAGQGVVVRCAGSWPTLSFVDETVAEVVQRRRAATLVFCGDEALRDLVVYCATERGLAHRVSYVSCETA
jgi:hypothetical protein